MQPNSKSLETVKRDVNEMLKYSTSTLPCKPHCIRQQEELQVQHDITRLVTKPNSRNDLVTQSLNHLVTSETLPLSCPPLEGGPEFSIPRRGMLPQQHFFSSLPICKSRLRLHPSPSYD